MIGNLGLGDGNVNPNLVRGLDEWQSGQEKVIRVIPMGSRKRQQTIFTQGEDAENDQ